MSNELESIIRPFQTNDITPSQTYYVPGQIGVAPIYLRIGRGGSGKVLTGNYSYDETFYIEAYETERKNPFASRAGQKHSQFVGKFGQGTIGQPMGGQ